MNDIPNMQFIANAILEEIYAGVRSKCGHDRYFSDVDVVTLFQFLHAGEVDFTPTPEDWTILSNICGELDLDEEEGACFAEAERLTGEPTPDRIDKETH